MWPLSRKKMPKQFYPLLEGKSLFEETIERNAKLCDDFLIVTNRIHYEVAKDMMPADKRTRFILEPMGRDTLPAVALAALAVDPEEIILITPADHIIGNEPAYQAVVAEAKERAEAGYLVTMGIQPGYPETGYGYIEAAGNDVKSFREKPDLETAKSYVESGNYYWNSGMFCFKAKTLLEEVSLHSNDVLTASKTTWEATDRTSPMELPSALMQKIPAISIDYGVMEKSQKVQVVPADIDWTDLGSFDALYDFWEQDSDGNVMKAEVENIDSKGNLFFSSRAKIAAIGIEDLIVIDTADVLLLCKKGESQAIKTIVKKLKEEGSELVIKHKEIG